MYNLSDIESIHLETSSKCQARCPQCGRFNFDYEDNKMKINPLITDRNGKLGALDEIYFSDFIKWFPPKFVPQLKLLYMCGTFGDPIFARDCLKIFCYLRAFNPKMQLSIHTNGSFRPKEWWEKLAKLKVKVVFGIDGLEDTHSLYRVNTNWNRVIENASAFIQAGGVAEWQMLIFKHNQHQISKCIELAKSLGFKTFRVHHTTRFTENDQKELAVRNPKGEITHYLEPSSISLQSFDKIDSDYSEDHLIEKTIDCSVKKNKEIYVSANGDLTPCCWMMSSVLYNQDDIADYKKKINMYPNLHKQTLKEIFDSLYFRKIQRTWENESLLICSKACGKSCDKKTGILESICNQNKLINLESLRL